MVQMVKHLPTMWETQVQSLGWEDPLEKEMATHSRTLAWKIPWMEETGRLQSMGFSRQEYWSGLPLPSPGDLPNPGIEPGSPALQADALPSEPPGKMVYGCMYGCMDVTKLIKLSILNMSCVLYVNYTLI